ncbi:MAG: response regulator [Bryobacteraceae bacterium]|jgi:two-component system alkaline phosphatase synthesis response regulator PhoP
MPNRILIVDDEILVLAEFKTALELEGYKVWTSQSAKAALTIVQEASFDLIVLDFIMPGMDGLELLARIRKHQPLVRSIIISGKLDGGRSEDDLTKTLGEQVEADLYLNKPVQNERLVAAVKALLTDTHGGDWKAIAGQLVQGQRVPIGKARAASKALKKSLKKKR